MGSSSSGVCSYGAWRVWLRMSGSSEVDPGKKIAQRYALRGGACHASEMSTLFKKLKKDGSCWNGACFPFVFL